MLTYTLKKTPGHPLYEQLYQSIRDDIAAGRLPAGSRLPSKRVLAAHLGVSVVTVESAYAQLLAEGYAEARPRSGVYVCAIAAASLCSRRICRPCRSRPRRSRCSTSAAARARTCRSPASVWVRTMREVIADKRLMQPVDFAGAPELRAAIAAIWSRRAACASRRSRSSSARARSTFMASSCSCWGAGCAMPSRTPATARSPASTRQMT